jgi:hypothetical protein
MQLGPSGAQRKEKMKRETRLLTTAIACAALLSTAGCGDDGPQRGTGLSSSGGTAATGGSGDGGGGAAGGGIAGMASGGESGSAGAGVAGAAGSGGNASMRNSLVVDPVFSESTLTPDARTWYTRFKNSVTSSRTHLLAQADKNDTFSYRSIVRQLTLYLHVLRATGDPWILGEIDVITERMRAQLSDSYPQGGDGYLNWLWQKNSDSQLSNTDLHQMDEMKTHGGLAAVVWAFRVNQDYEPRYKERADFWQDYLTNHFEAKWRARKGKSWPRFPVLEKTLAHAHSRWIVYHHYMGKLTGKHEYATEAERLLDQLLHPGYWVDCNGAYVWRHAVSPRTPDYAQRFVYARATLASMIDLHLEGLRLTEVDAIKLMRTVRDHFIDSGSPESFAKSTAGDGTQCGISARDSEVRHTQGRYAQGWTYMAPLARWDDTGTIAAINAQVYQNLWGTSDNPSQPAIPAAMVLHALRPTP